MNEDDVEAMVHYCRIAHIPLPEGSIPTMAGVDTEGLHLRVGARVARFDFESPVRARLEVCEALVAMARRDR